MTTALLNSKVYPSHQSLASSITDTKPNNRPAWTPLLCFVLKAAPVFPLLGVLPPNTLGLCTAVDEVLELEDVVDDDEATALELAVVASELVLVVLSAKVLEVLLKHEHERKGEQNRSVRVILVL